MPIVRTARDLYNRSDPRQGQLNNLLAGSSQSGRIRLFRSSEMPAPRVLRKATIGKHELAINTETDTVVKAYETKAGRLSKERTEALVRFQVLVHQPDQPRHLLRERSALKLLGYRDGGQTLIPAAHSENANTRRHTGLALDVDVLPEPLPLGFQPLQFTFPYSAAEPSATPSTG